MPLSPLFILFVLLKPDTIHEGLLTSLYYPSSVGWNLSPLVSSEYSSTLYFLFLGHVLDSLLTRIVSPIHFSGSPSDREAPLPEFLVVVVFSNSPTSSITTVIPYSILISHLPESCKSQNIRYLPSNLLTCQNSFLPFTGLNFKNVKIRSMIIFRIPPISLLSLSSSGPPNLIPTPTSLSLLVWILYKLNIGYIKWSLKLHPYSLSLLSFYRRPNTQLINQPIITLMTLFSNTPPYLIQSLSTTRNSLTPPVRKTF